MILSLSKNNVMKKVDNCKILIHHILLKNVCKLRLCVVKC